MPDPSTSFFSTCPANVGFFSYYKVNTPQVIFLQSSSFVKSILNLWHYRLSSAAVISFEARRAVRRVTSDPFMSIRFSENNIKLPEERSADAPSAARVLEKCSHPGK